MKKFIESYSEYHKNTKINEAKSLGPIDIKDIKNMNSTELQELYNKFGYRYIIDNIGGRTVFRAYKFTPKGKYAKEKIVVNMYVKNADEKAFEFIENVINSLNRRNEYKRQQKEKGGATSPHASAAKQLREELKKTFPDTKFSVKSESFSGGDSIRISWTDGAAYNDVRKIGRKYQEGSFNGMEDIYEYDKEKPEGIIDQVTYVFADRDYSADLLDMIYKELEISKDDYKDRDWRNAVRISLDNLNIPKNVVGVKIPDNTLIWNYRDGSGIEFITSKLENETNTTEVEKADFEIVDYSDLSFAVIGNTYSIKDKLAELGGRFNRNLTIDGERKAGWIFSKKKKEAVEKLKK
jgi:hypothetical protein